VTKKELVTCSYYCDACGKRKDDSCEFPPSGWGEMARMTTASCDLPSGLCFCGDCLRTWRLVDRNFLNYARCAPIADRKDPWGRES